MWNSTKGIVFKISQLLWRRRTLFFLFFFLWGKKTKVKTPHSLRYLQTSLSGANSFDGRKMTFAIAASNLWPCWDSPILTLDISVNIIHLTSDSKDMNLSKSLVGFCSIQENGVEGSSAIWETAERKGRKAVRREAWGFFFQILWGLY